MEQTPLHTPLHDVHLQLGARMMAFAGYDMPLSYSGIRSEHLSVRNACGLFDVSHMGQFTVSGQGALAFLQFITTNDVSRLKVGQAQYSCIPHEDGGIVDDLLVYRMGDDAYMLVVNASRVGEVAEVLSLHARPDCFIDHISQEIALLALQGPLAVDVLEACTSEAVRDLAYYHFCTGAVAGVDGVIISATGYTGAGGFELYIPKNSATKVWHALMEAGAAHGILPCGLGARDTLRLEKGYCLNGHELSYSSGPVEARLDWIVRYNKDFIHKDLLLNKRNGGCDRYLVGFEMIDKGIPRHDFEILDATGQQIGVVSSGSESPSTAKLIGLGFVDPEHQTVGSYIWINIRGKNLKAQLVKLPFV
ncbi:MAG: glycine cleavage system aminomethyltransferase GcvT [Bacteroidetes bacterium]|nr:glycine cleavage system aminomethyltransferase GcvT [Bacteroidota bacterium]